VGVVPHISAGYTARSRFVSSGYSCLSKTESSQRWWVFAGKFFIGVQQFVLVRARDLFDLCVYQ
jgi:hypothetical protein